MIRKAMFVTFCVCAAMAQQPPTELRLFLGDGPGLAFHTESSGPHSPLSMNGSVSTSGRDGAYRVVLGKDGRIVFAYSLSTRKLSPGVLTVQLKPVDQEKIRQESWFPKDQPAGDVATLALTREFAGLRIGDLAQVDILYHPVTGEKIWDVLRVVEPVQSSQPSKPYTGERFSFEQVKVVIDGKTISEPRNTWMIGQAIMMRITGRGAYYMVLTPSTDFPFQASGWVDHNVLRFNAGNELVEITGKSNMLQKSEFGTVWVYHVPESKDGSALQRLQAEFAEKRRIYTANHPEIRRLQLQLAMEQLNSAMGRLPAGRVTFTCADNMEQLLPTKGLEE